MRLIAMLVVVMAGCRPDESAYHAEALAESDRRAAKIEQERRESFQCFAHDEFGMKCADLRGHPDLDAGWRVAPTQMVREASFLVADEDGGLRRVPAMMAFPPGWDGGR